MPIGRGIRSRGPGAAQADKDWADLSPARVYNDSELRSFHEKIQKFHEDKTLTDGTVLSILNQDKLAVAFGAMSVIQYQGKPYYRALAGADGTCKRMGEFTNVMNQYDDWRRKQDWIDAKRAEDFDFMAQQEPVKELSTGILAEVSQGI